MKVAAKVVLVFVAVLALPLLLSQPAWAVACTTTPTFTLWEAATGGCTDTDKIYTFISSGTGGDLALPGTSTFSVGTVLQPPSSALHTVAFGFGVTLAPGTYNLEYTIQITTQSPQPIFGTVNLDTTVPGGTCGTSPCSAIKNIFEANGTHVITDLQSDNGVPSGTPSFPAGLTFIDVHEVFTVPTGGVLSGATNTYTELNVPQTTPAPASLILLGLGLVGAGAGVLRRKIKAA